jgi:Family of unknown function (DUF6526)
MQEQNFKNHSRLIFLWHGVTVLLILAIITGSIVNLLHSDAHNHYSAVTLLAVSLVFPLLWAYARIFALKAQDRAIRAEENFRHFILTGKPFDKQIRLGQIIALRFASDEEFPALAKKAVEEKLSQKQIKQAIQNWRADYHRV